MKRSLCGLDCSQCEMNSSCAGCEESCGRPFGEKCVTALFCKEGTLCDFKKKLLDSFNSLGIEDMNEITELYAVKGSFVNLPLPLPNGNTAKFWLDDAVYLCNQVQKNGTDRFYGLTADENFLMVCEYGENGADAQIVAYKRLDR